MGISALNVLIPDFQRSPPVAIQFDKSGATVYSPDGKKLAYVAKADSTIYAYIGDVLMHF